MTYTSFTSESVSAAHPDKICDAISDAVVDQALTFDKYARVAVETLVSTNRVVLAGEVTCQNKLNYRHITKSVIKKLGYTQKSFNFWDGSPISVYVHEQSADIAQGVDTGGAGDQGMMFGFACTETPELMPTPIILCHRLIQEIDKLKTTGLPMLYPDGKCEIKVNYRNGRPVGIERVVVAVPHQKNFSNQEIKKLIYDKAIVPILEKYKYKPPPLRNVILNGTGIWTNGGPQADTGVTGRKIIVDTYGGMARHGGGCFSGKDPTKVDRSGAYACRFLAKNIVAQGFAKRCEVRVAYVIGQAEPVDQEIECFGTETKPLKVIKDFAIKLLKLNVGDILEKLELRQPIYLNTASYGHFGRDGFPWEKVTGL